MKDKFTYNEAMVIFESLENLVNSDVPPPNPSFEWHGYNYELPIWTWYGKYRLTIFKWIRAFFYPLICFYWIDFIYQVIRGQKLFNVTPRNTYSPMSLPSGSHDALPSGSRHSLPSGSRNSLPPGRG